LTSLRLDAPRSAIRDFLESRAEPREEDKPRAHVGAARLGTSEKRGGISGRWRGSEAAPCFLSRSRR
jgi:hypothetical protein